MDLNIKLGSCRNLMLVVCVAISFYLLGFVVLVSRADEESSTDTSSGEKLDRFGGLAFSVAQPSGYFRVQKVGNRWLFLTPEGHPFWMRSVYAVDLMDGGAQSEQTLKTKYGGMLNVFAQRAVRRLRAWGFNTIGEYSSIYVFPLPTYFRPTGNSEQMPFIRILNISWYGALDEDHLAPAPFKTLLAGAVDPQIYQGWAGHIPDVFDPNFAIYARNSAGDLKTGNRQAIFTEKTDKGGLPNPSLAKSPWLLGTEPDDADDLFGFGPGPKEPGNDGAIHPHIGWVIAVTKPTQSQNTEVGTVIGGRRTINYSDPVVYAKRAWRDFLVQKYHTIDALNAAWGSHYTTFDSDGGWPNGKGLMDESGRNPWIGNDGLKLSATSPKVIPDLDAFLGVYADQYFRVVTEAIHAATPNQLVFSPTVDSHGGMTRPQILEAAGKYCDVIEVTLDPAKASLLARTYEITKKPMFSWMGIRANQDSALRDPNASNTAPGPATQADRSAAYAQQIAALFSMRASDGTFPIVGMDWWEYMDKVGEKSNWGLVTPKDNAYDGKEDVTGSGSDRWGFATGNEAGNFGDFVTGVRDSNLMIDRQIASELQRARTSAVPQGPSSERPR